MKELLKRLSNIGGRSAATPGDPRISLAAFGKHPAWDDHIPGVGVDTEALAHLKQLFYVTGIGGQIDSAAWEKLDSSKRLEGFDHSFLWLRAGHVMLGQLWSSSDRKGRSKYPMILCIDGEHISPGVVLANGWLELEHLRDKCKALTSAEQVATECHASLERLRLALANQEKRMPEFSLNPEAWQLFFECPELGPNRIGLLRVLHELRYSVAGGAAKNRPPLGASSQAHARHLRVPVIGSLRAVGSLPWVEFLRCVIPSEIPMFFIKRTDASWLDVILGEPTGDEFFCLQASLDAVPLATEIPYEIAPELKLALQELEGKFIKMQPSPAMSVAGQLEPQAITGFERGAGREGSSKDGKPQFVWYGIIGAVILIVVVGLALLGKQKINTPVVVVVKQVTNEPSTTSSKAERAAIQEQKYQSAIQSAQNALINKEYDRAVQQAEAAIAAKPGDAAAVKLKTDAESRKSEAVVAQKKKQQCEAAMGEGEAALKKQNYEEAIRQAETALVAEPGDAGAQDLKNKAETQKSRMLAEQQRKQVYADAMRAAKSAYDQQNYDETIRQAEAALAAEPADVAAAELKADAKSQMIVQQKERQYQLAIQAAQTAWNKKEFAILIQQSDIALNIKPGDKPAADFKARGTAMLEVQSNLKNGNYEKAIDLCKLYPDVETFSTLAGQIKAKEIEERESLYVKLDLYSVCFGVVKPKDAKYPQNRNARPIETQNKLLRDLEDYQKELEEVAQKLEAGGWLDENRKKIVKDIEKNIYAN